MFISSKYIGVTCIKTVLKHYPLHINRRKKGETENCVSLDF